MRKLWIAPVTLLFLALLAGCTRQESVNSREASRPPSPQQSAQAPSVGLHEAALNGNVEAIRQHIAIGADLNQKDPAGGASPLITAAAFGQTEVARVLIEGGADLDFKNGNGETALGTAAFLCRTEIVKLLLESGADKTSRNNAGATAFDSVVIPFETVRPIYDLLASSLGPLGLQLDYEQIQATRPKIAALLR